MIPVVNANKCTGCGECEITGCPCVTFKVKNGIAHVTVKQPCVGCEFCAEECPSHAITISKKKKKKKKV